MDVATQLELCLYDQLACYLFPYFLLRSLLPFLIFNFYFYTNNDTHLTWSIDCSIRNSLYISVQPVRGKELIDLLFTDSIPQTTGIIYTDFPYTVKPLNNGHLGTS